jgi:hypothetical protein
MVYPEDVFRYKICYGSDERRYANIECLLAAIGRIESEKI